MKKLVLSVLLLTLIAFYGCGDNASNKKPQTTVTTATTTVTTSGQMQTTTMSPQKVKHIANKLKNGMLENFDGCSDADKEAIKKAVAKDGYTLVFKDDGSGVLSNDEGEWTVAAGWVENEYTQGVPEIDFGIITMSVEDEDKQGKYYMFYIRQASFNEVKEYVELLEKTGFDIIEDKALNEEGSMVVFNSSNKEGKHISLGYSSHGLTLEITK